MKYKTNTEPLADNSIALEKIDMKLGRIEETQEKGFAFLIEKIDNIPVSQAPPPPSAEPPAATPIEVKLPDDIARSGDFRKFGEVMQITNGSMRTVVQGMGELSKSIAEIPRVDAKAIAEATATATSARVEANLLPKIKKAVSDAIPLPQPAKAPAIGVDDVRSINSKLSRIEQTISDSGKAEAKNKMIRKLWIIIVFDLLIAFGSLYWALTLNEENEHLRRVEWLYRWSRSTFKDSETFHEIERDMLYGTKRERENYKTVIFNNERTSPQFQYFRPVDDWRPEPPKPAQNNGPKQEPSSPNSFGGQGPTKPKSSTQQPVTRPKSDLTPGEIEAIKALRANPHIPDDAKPPLPEGY